MTSTVAVVKTSPETLKEDVKRVMEAANYKKYLPPEQEVAIKLNLSWSKFYPACSTTPYIFDYLLDTMIHDGGISNKKITAVENETVVTNIYQGIRKNRWLPVMKKHKIKFVPLVQDEWVHVKLPRKTLVLEDIFHEVIAPKSVIGKNIVHLPTIKTHGHSGMTGALKNSFGLFLTKNRHLAHLKIHEVLVDLLMLQKEVAPHTFILTDGTILGDGPGPRTMIPHIGNILLASNDPVAIDTVQTLVMGLPLKAIKKLQIASEYGLGESNPDKIKITGDFSSIDELPNFHLTPAQSPVIHYNRVFLDSPLEYLLFRTIFFQFPRAASGIYHDWLWLPLFGKKHVKWYFNTPYGKLFNQYSEV